MTASRAAAQTFSEDDDKDDDDRDANSDNDDDDDDDDDSGKVCNIMAVKHATTAKTA